MTTPPPTDEFARTIASARQGDAVAWEHIVTSYGNRVRAAIRRQMPEAWIDAEHVEDVFQEIMLSLANALREAGLTSRASFEAYLVHVTRSRCADWARRQTRTRRDVRRERQDVELDREAAPISSPSRTMRRADARMGLQAILERLPENQRVVLRWIHLERLRPCEVAARLGIREEAVRKRLERALRACREIAARESFDDWRLPSKEGS
ncbi:MAG: sigma-70 family RNA polymerase sigma factor [Planctomycetes bacterium]|nr:sigma-70 family RNA polymerase sigma factor [Planctomycetota bacterium]